MKKSEKTTMHERYFDIRYRDVIVGKGEVDILVGGMLVLELKAVSKIVPAHVSQARSYLKALNLDLALLMNFSDTTLSVHLLPLAKRERSESSTHEQARDG